ncbi:DUF721 domain-containing protein [Schlesneria paludicola]|uniref:DUF721 domain-containing protein n=1 Tax=Schlesneria paludicola TaxID=360056 RepID=UPI00029A4B80|nr:DUF721 domain-containing protein [Schlesneria paludicola]
MAARDPQLLSLALSELIALRGFARVRGDNELEAVWKAVAGPELAAQTRPLQVSRGVLMVSVENAPLLSEISAFQGPELLQRLKQKAPHLKIKNLKFKLSGT